VLISALLGQLKMGMRTSLMLGMATAILEKESVDKLQPSFAAQELKTP
jgi:hypothetical protein